MINKRELYESRVVQLENILDKLDKMFHMDEYKSSLNDIKKIVEEKNNSKLGEDEIPYEEYSDKINNIIDSVNSEYTDCYRIHLLNKVIEKDLSNVNELNYKEVCDNVKGLIIMINKVVYIDRDDFRRVISKSYELIARIILKEVVLEKHEIINEINKTNEVIKNNISIVMGNIITSNLSEDEAVKVELEAIKNKLGYYLNEKVLHEIAMKTNEEDHNAYVNRRRTATAEFLDTVSSIDYDKEELKEDKKESNSKLMKALKKVSVVRLKIVSLILLPMVLLYGSTLLSGRDYKYKTIKKEIVKDKIIDESSEYDFHIYAYDMTIEKYGPWIINGTEGYKREVQKYYYYSNDKEPISPNKLLEGVKKPDVEFEYKEVLDENDNTVDPEIIVTEVIRDENDYHKSHAGTVLSLLFGMLILLMGELFLQSKRGDGNGYFSLIGDEIKKLKRLKEDYPELANYKVTRKLIKERKEEIKDRIVTLREDYSTVTTNYGDFVSSLSEEEIQDVKKYIKI